MKYALMICTGLIVLNSCHTSKEESSTTEENSEELVISGNKTAVAVIGDKNNSGVSGTVTFTQGDNFVTMDADISGLSGGKHAIHIHEKGDCSSADASSAGSHWNPTEENHGEWGNEPFHIGDIGNLEAGGEATSSHLTRDTDLWCIGCGDPEKDILGKAIIIHAGADDFKSQPGGNAGDRIGCGEIVESEVM